jgi:hypothetical protein
MAALSVTAASVLASAQATIRKEYTRAGTQTAGQAVYLNDANQWATIDNSAVTLGVTTLIGITLDAGAINQPASVCVKDPTFTPGATMTVGIVIYTSTTAGGITMAEIPTTAEQTTVLGVAKTTTTMNLNPITSGVMN